ncbi:HD domain-containing protein [Pseudobutyrivibrio sp. YE44]|uniref:HD-GYP domain-containing protein n=1 Tax=Pseudobutyrivibrio sp. YE44 TaxID=1520802 RepID=UPI0008881918|nr:HD domain-containing phosphohydrolase [Pseudobutyrivibrio sp. YE44]SDB50962.1 HD domain-containing protein [Pseudobutyrivibrio sp. YE44]
MELSSFLIGYWPKFFSAFAFAVLNIIVAAKYVKSKRYFVERFVTGYLISPSFISIWGELGIMYLYNFLIDNHYFADPHNLIYIFMSILADATLVFLGGMMFSYCTGMWNFKGAAVYMEFVCIERLTLVVATNYWSYVALYVLFCATLFYTFRKESTYIVGGLNVNWKRIFFHLAGLFYILDLLYAAYYIFPDLGTNILDAKNLFWLDMVAIINVAFVGGYMKVRIDEAKEHEDKIKYFQKLQHSQEDIIIMLADISEAKSGETGQHVRRVAEYSRLLAQHMGLSYYDSETIKIAAMMHDLGKLMISQDIIEKPGMLTPEEYETIKEHSKYGYDILSKSDGDIIKMARTIALEHHEYWNGQGYPNGLKGDEISIYAQIVSVADVFDALTSKRAYKEAWSTEDAIEEIKRQRGEQFSPAAVDAFIECLDGILEIKNMYLD